MSDVLPEDLLWRPKQAFRTPLQHWLGATSPLRWSAGSDIRDHELGYLDGEAVQRSSNCNLSAKENARTSSGFC